MTAQKKASFETFSRAMIAPRSLVFLHIPKTAGQMVHAELSRLMGADFTSPVRIHGQRSAERQFPKGYRFYSGHLDWTALYQTPAPRFTFTVLRDPRERIASFYFSLRREAEKLTQEELSAPRNMGKRMILKLSADDYFFGATKAWQHFIRDRYDNFYCSYLATKQVRGFGQIRHLKSDALLARAETGASQLDGIYTTDRLSLLEDDIFDMFGAPINLTSKRINAGPGPARERRWPALLQRFETDLSVRRIEQMVALDLELLTILTRRGWLK